MSTATAHRPAHQAPPHGSPLTGTWNLLRLYVRRDRVVAPLWILLLSVPLSTVYVGSTRSVYPTEEDRAAFATSIMASPAQRALYGQVYSDSIGAVGIWKAGMFHLLIAVAVILTVIRHTRADEETGRTELLGSTSVGRYAGLTAALLLSFGASITTGVIATAGLLTLDIPAAGSFAFGAALACSGLVFSAVGAVAAQLSPSARFARGAAFSVLAASFTIRAVGDAGASALSWLSPLGWSLLVKPFAGDRFWILGLHLALTVICTAAAYGLLARRDVGAGLFAERPGPAAAGRGLGGTFGLAWRLDRGALLLWTVGLCLYGLLIGSVVDGIADEMGGSQQAFDMVTRLGGSQVLEQAFIAVAFSMLGMIASAFVISLTLRLHAEETSQHAEALLAGSVSRTRWLASHLSIAMAGSAAAMLITGLVTGLTYGASTGDPIAKVPTVVGTALVQLPVIWLLAAITVVIFGVVPRFAPAAWGVLVLCIALFLLGSLSGLPHWVLDLSPFAHIPVVGAGQFDAQPLAWLLGIDLVLITVGCMTFRRRDLR